MIEFTDDELRYIAAALMDQGIPHGMLCVTSGRGEVVDVCPDCMHEIWYNDEDEETGHGEKCGRIMRYALMDKLDGYYGEEK